MGAVNMYHNQSLQLHVYDAVLSSFVVILSGETAMNDLYNFMM